MANEPANPNATSVYTNRTIALLADWFDEYYQETIRHTAEEAVAQRGSTLLSFAGGIPGSLTRDSHQRHAVFDLMRREKLDGAILLAGTMVNELGSQGLTELLDNLRGLPLCSIGVEIKDVPSILVDNQSGVDRALTHLVEHHDCERIAFIRGPAKNKEAESRFLAYQEGLQRLGIKRDAALVFQGDFLSASGEAAVAHFVQTRSMPDAIIAANDEMALGALSALTSLGKSVPGDIRLVGFDDLQRSRLSTPPITTVRQPLRDLAIAAVRTIMDQILGREVPRLQVLQTQLVVRESCGCSMRLSSTGRSQYPEANTSGEPSFVAAFDAQRHALRAELARAARGEFHNLGPWEDALIAALQEDISGGPVRFADELSKRIAQVANGGGDMSRWHDIVTAFRRVAVPSCGSDAQLRARAEDVLHEARLLTAHAVERAEAQKRINAEGFTRALQRASAALAGAFDEEALAQAVRAHLPELGIAACYVSAYSPIDRIGDAPLPEARFICGYDPEHRMGIADERPFPSTSLTPESIWASARAHRLTVLPLFLRDKQLGFALVESHGVSGSVIEMVRAQLSIALYGVFLQRRLTP